MNFRLKLFLSIVAAVLFTELAEAGLDTLATHVRKDISQEMNDDLGRYAQTVVAAFDLRGGLPRLDVTALETLGQPSKKIKTWHINCWKICENRYSQNYD